MSPTLVRIKDHFSHWREWELNPVVVKELRQAVRSRLLTVTLLLLLASMLVASLVFFAGQSYFVEENQQLGLPIFRVFLVILAVASFVFIPLYTGIRLGVERLESDVDLMFATPLPAQRIIRGKFLCGAYVAILFFSAGMPFMAFTNMLRGVDLPTIGLVLVCLYAAVCLAVQAAIFVACLRFRLIVKAFLGILFAAGLMAVCGLLVVFLFGMLQYGIQGMLGKPASRIGFVVIMILIALGILWLQLVSVALIAANNLPRGYFDEIVREGAP